jgi:endogenous inhibitor of DNA gyrase (YacG/DUF329 family)
MAKTSSANRPQFYPFCSDRCKWVDLGAWLDEDYVIVAGSDSDEPQISEQEQDDEES